MNKTKLIEIFHTNDGKVRLQYDEKTSELYVNDKKVITEIGFKRSEKVLAWIVAISVAIQALMSILSFLFSRC